MQQSIQLNVVKPQPHSIISALKKKRAAEFEVADAPTTSVLKRPKREPVHSRRIQFQKPVSTSSNTAALSLSAASSSTFNGTECEECDLSVKTTTTKQKKGRRGQMRHMQMTTSNNNNNNNHVDNEQNENAAAPTTAGDSDSDNSDFEMRHANEEDEVSRDRMLQLVDEVVASSASAPTALSSSKSKSEHSQVMENSSSENSSKQTQIVVDQGEDVSTAATTSVVTQQTRGKPTKFLAIGIRVARCPKKIEHPWLSKVSQWRLRNRLVRHVTVINSHEQIVYDKEIVYPEKDTHAEHNKVATNGDDTNDEENDDDDDQDDEEDEDYDDGEEDEEDDNDDEDDDSKEKVEANAPEKRQKRKKTKNKPMTFKDHETSIWRARGELAKLFRGRILIGWNLHSEVMPLLDIRHPERHIRDLPRFEQFVGRDFEPLVQDLLGMHLSPFLKTPCLLAQCYMRLHNMYRTEWDELLKGRPGLVSADGSALPEGQEEEKSLPFDDVITDVLAQLKKRRLDAIAAAPPISSDSTVDIKPKTATRKTPRSSKSMRGRRHPANVRRNRQ